MEDTAEEEEGGEEEPWEYDSEALKHWEQFVKKSKATQVQPHSLHRNRAGAGRELHKHAQLTWLGSKLCSTGSKQDSCQDASPAVSAAAE